MDRWGDRADYPLMARSGFHARRTSIFKAYSSFKFETKMNFKFDAKMNGLKFAIEVTGEKHRRLRSGRALSTHKFSAREADA
jgi:hypothetical protein